MTAATRPAEERPTARGALSVHVTAEGVALITFDLPGESVNKLSAAVKDEFLATFERQEGDAAVRAMVFVSGKPDTFIAGADIEEFLQLRTAKAAEELSREGQRMVERLEQSRKPVVFAIHGACLGGGLEAALAAHYRIATDHPKTVLALPEVMLGLIPGAGGTQRLPRLVGPARAKDLIFSGRRIPAKEAQEIGLVDVVAPPGGAYDEAVKIAKRYAAGPRAALRAAKIAINWGGRTDLRTGLAIERETFTDLFATEDQKERMRAFLEKRDAAFRGR